VNGSDPDTGDLTNLGTDPVAFEAFYRRYMDPVQQFIARRVTDPHTAADLTAEVFVAVIESAASYRPARGSEVAWLFGIARNIVAAEGRRSARRLRANGLAAGRRLLDTDDLVRIEERHAYLGRRNTVENNGRDELFYSTAVLRLAIVDRPGQLP
jgi:RNA polymerase sigma factor (sigma-70 family)